MTVWTPEFVQLSLEWLALQAALARRRAIWLTRLFDSSVVLSGAVGPYATPPIPPGDRRPVAARREAFTLGSFDRLRVLMMELKRLIAALDESRLASALWWV